MRSSTSSRPSPNTPGGWKGMGEGGAIKHPRRGLGLSTTPCGRLGVPAANRTPLTPEWVVEQLRERENPRRCGAPPMKDRGGEGILAGLGPDAHARGLGARAEEGEEARAQAESRRRHRRDVHRSRRLDGETGRPQRKAPSTPPRFIDGVIDALDKAQDAEPAEMAVFKHGSTIATNAIIERAGAKTGLVTTEGFRDVLARRAGQPARPLQLQLGPARRRWSRAGTSSRCASASTTRATSCRARRGDVRERGARVQRSAASSPSPSPSSTRSWTPTTSARTKEILLAELGDGVASARRREILPEIREFERTSTAVANAYLMPVIDRYIDGLVARASRDWGYDGELLVTHSGGGVVTGSAARAACPPASATPAPPAASSAACSSASSRASRA